MAGHVVHQRLPGRRLARHRTGVGGDERGAEGRATDRQQHHLDAGLAGAPQRRAQVGAVADGLQDQREHAGVGVVDDVVDVVGGGGDQLLARRDREVEAEAQAGAQQRREHRAGVGHQRHRPDGQVVALGVADAPAARGVRSRTPCSPRRTSAMPASQAIAPELARGRRRRGRCRRPPRRGHRPWRPRSAGRRAGASPTPSSTRSGASPTACEVGQARVPGDLVVRRVHQPDPLEPRRAQHLADHPLAEAARPRRWRRRTRPCAPRAWREERPPGFVTGLTALLSQRVSSAAASASCGRRWPPWPPASRGCRRPRRRRGSRSWRCRGRRWGAVVGVARRRPHVEQLLGRELAVEDVAADQPVLLLHLVRADDVAVR